jgi:hypothetical protein
MGHVTPCAVQGMDDRSGVARWVPLHGSSSAIPRSRCAMRSLASDMATHPRAPWAAEPCAGGPIDALHGLPCEAQGSCRTGVDRLALLGRNAGPVAPATVGACACPRASGGARRAGVGTASSTTCTRSDRDRRSGGHAGPRVLACVAIAPGDYCGSRCLCPGTGTIRASALPKFNADVSRTPVGTGTSKPLECQCVAPMAPCCRVGMCLMGSWCLLAVDASALPLCPPEITCE